MRVDSSWRVPLARRSARRVLVAGLTGLLAALSHAATSDVSATAVLPSNGAPSHPAVKAVAPLAAPLRTIEGLGVELMSVGLSASGFMIDVRYRVVDAAKAQALAERKVSPTLINSATGDRYYVPVAPKIGPLRQSATAKQPLLPGRVYFMLFANPDRRLRQGEKVSLHVGEAVVEDIVVR